MAESEEKVQGGASEESTEKESSAVNDSKSPQQQEQQQLSKRQLKKLKRRENKLAFRSIKRKEEKQRRKERRKQRLQQGDDLGPSRKKLKMVKMKNSACKVNVVVDCSFDDYMKERDVHMLVKQIQHCYSVNRRAEQPVQFTISSISGKTKDILDRIGDYKHWDVNVKTEDYITVFGKEKAVYLSSESNNVLTSLDPEKVYIIGGLVDHNHQKGLCHRLAEEKGIAHAQLPIAEFLDMKTRKVLTIDHVFEILLRFTETGNWEESFFKVIPKRKGAVSKSQPNISSDNSASDQNDKVESSTGEHSTKNDNQDSSSSSESESPSDIKNETLKEVQENS